MDGSGYPKGLTGDEIPLGAKIVRIAESFDSITHKNIQGEVKDVEYALNELRSGANTKYDSELVAMFIKYIESIQ